MRMFLILLGVVMLVLVSAGQAIAAYPAVPWSEGQPVNPNHPPTIASPNQSLGLGGGGAVAGADYIVKMQADVTEDNAGNGNPDSPDDPDDGGWDWSSTIFSHSTGLSELNLYGVCALGIYHTYLLSPKTTYFTAMKDAADKMVANASIRSSSDMIFLMLFDDLPNVPGNTYRDAAKTKYLAVLAAHGGTATLFAQWLRDERGVAEGYPNGIIGWDVGAFAVVAGMLDARFPGSGYDSDCDAIAEVLYQDSFADTPGLFDVVDDAGWDPTGANANYWWYNLGIAGLIDAFQASGTHTGEVPGLIGRLQASMVPSGAVCGSYGVHAGDEDWQTTGYAMMSLAGFGTAYASSLVSMGGWLLATQDVSGAWLYAGGVHYPEVGSEATIGLALVPATVGPVAPSGCISVGAPCVTIPFGITRFDGAQMRAYSISFTLSPELMLCGSVLGSITQGAYLSGLTSYHVVDNGGGAYTVDCAILGLPCGATGSTGTLFNVQVKKAGGNGTGTVTAGSVLLRDCANAPLPSVTGPPAPITIDATPPVAITNMASQQKLTGNDADGTTKIQVTFTVPGDAAETKVYRAPYGLVDGTSAYPEYDDMVGAGAPIAAAYPPGAPWALTGVTATGQMDESSTRGFWYYVAYAKDACGNWSPASNVSAGSLNYHLGDVAPIGTGNNVVDTPDISALGGSYGTFSPGVNYLDVGPTLDYSVNGLPLTDNQINFEDLMMFAINYHQVSFQGTSPTLVSLGGQTRSGAASLTAGPIASLFRTGQAVDVPVVLHGADAQVQGIHTLLSYDPTALAYQSTEVAGSIQSQSPFFKDLPSSGQVDLSLAVLGGGSAISGEGIVMTVHFQALRNGPASVRLSETNLRGMANQELTGQPNVTSIQSEQPKVLPLQYRLDAHPNPFNPKTTISFDLPQTSAVRIVVFDASGRQVRLLASGQWPAGSHEVVWDGRNDGGRLVGSGIYFYAMRAGAWQSQKRMTLLK